MKKYLISLLLVSSVVSSSFGDITNGPYSLVTYAALSNALAHATNGAILSLSRDFGVTGVGVETAKYQLALNSGKTVLFDITGTCGNCTIGNGVNVIGSGTNKVNFDASATGVLFDSTTNTHDYSFIGLTVDGNEVGFLSFGGHLPWSYDIPNVNQQASVVRTAFHVYASATNAAFINCRATRFSQFGWDVDGYGNTLPQPTGATVKLIGCEASYNWMGYFTENSGEYVVFNGCYGEENGRGIHIQSGNITATGCSFTRNGEAVRIYGDAPNPAHGQFTGCVFNHNEIGLVAFDFNNGEIFQGCSWLGGGVFLGTNAFFITNTAGVSFDGCNIGAQGIMVDGGSGATAGANYLNNCKTQGGINIVTTNSGILISDGFRMVVTNGLRRYTNGAQNLFTNITTLGGEIALTNAHTNVPSNTNLIKGWIVITNSGTSISVPFYQ